MNYNRLTCLIIGCSLYASTQLIHAAPVSDIATTKHNLSASGKTVNGATAVSATSESQICVFCHTPHGANSAAAGPLWNRQITDDATYTDPYTSESIDIIGAASILPDGSSKLCLSCHDGTIAIGKVNVRLDTTTHSTTTADIAMDNTDTVLPGTMPDDYGSTTGFTRDLGTNMSNDHPISFTYTSSLAGLDGELHDPGYSITDIDYKTGVGQRSSTNPPVLALDKDDKVQCTTCHDPHISKNINGDTATKFVKANRFQTTNGPADDVFSPTSDIICLACHKKKGWADSAHARANVAAEQYGATSAGLRDFPDALPVWRAACLNCHDTHTVQGARRLLREGTDDLNTPKKGGGPALEETCYQCHSPSGALTAQGDTTHVPDIQTDFGLLYHMPITSTEQRGASEVHAIGTGTEADEGLNRGKDFVEEPDLLGKDLANSLNRHAECTDCHNPHRVKKSRKFNGSGGGDAAGTHTHASGTVHTNIASGVLSGITGVDPIYPAASAWGQADANIGFALKRGVGTSEIIDNTSEQHVSREYQVCLKCHSNYAWPNDNPPQFGPSIGINNVTQYTNQAMEFHPADPGETAADHSSWHPVIDSTGRDATLRFGTTDPSQNGFLAPWNGVGAADADTYIGAQSMYCSDCHGSNTGAQTVVPGDGTENDAPWGPHGSTNPFILKGPWSGNTGSATPDDLCFKCHEWDQYANNAPNPVKFSGFRMAAGTAGNQCNLTTNKEVNLHVGHANVIGSMQCTWCHVAVPHGWGNKALLVDINDEGAPANAAFTKAPYYLGAQLGGSGNAVTWKNSGTWTAGDCGGVNWMNGGGAGAGGGCPY